SSSWINGIRRSCSERLKQNNYGPLACWSGGSLRSLPSGPASIGAKRRGCGRSSLILYGLFTLAQHIPPNEPNQDSLRGRIEPEAATYRVIRQPRPGAH